jgi:hypothetical protein
MAFASAALTEMQRQATGGRNPNLPSAVNSGLVGVTTNPRNNSYHHSKNSAPFKSEGAYTNRWRNDLVRVNSSINKDAVTGSDTSMNRRDMIKSTQQFKRVFDDHSDPRRKYFAEVIGTLDGDNAIRMDFGDGSVDPASDDHTWHLHKGWWYLYWGSWEAADADLSVQRGETKAQYIARIGGTPPPSTEEDEDMDRFLAKLTTVANRATVWKGNGLPGTLIALPNMRAYDDLKANGYKEYHYGGQHAGDATSIVAMLGTLPREFDPETGNWETTQENYNRSVAAVNAAG